MKSSGSAQRDEGAPESLIWSRLDQIGQLSEFPANFPMDLPAPVISFHLSGDQQGKWISALGLLIEPRNRLVIGKISLLSGPGETCGSLPSNRR